MTDTCLGRVQWRRPSAGCRCQHVRQWRLRVTVWMEGEWYCHWVM